MKGISSIEAKQKQEKNGFNELKSTKSRNVFKIAFDVVKEPMFLLLISCGLLYMILGDYQEGFILLSTIFIIIGITFYQSNKTEKALEALKKLSSPRALVIRDGIEVRIPGREVVVDDIVILNEGDRVPADAIVVEEQNITIDESLLTGESVAVSKQEGSTQHAGKVFSGTLVVRGRALVRVVGIGSETEFGKIGSSLDAIDKDETRLQKEMKILIRNLFIIGAIISIGVIILFYTTRGNLINAILSGISSAMAILPEEFPVVLTVFLALGAWRLSKVNVLTRNPSAIETLGSATVLCTDKTGTITQNKMEVVCVSIGNSIIQKVDFVSRRKEVSDLLQYGYFATTSNSIDPMEKAIDGAYKYHSIPVVADQFKLVKEYPLSKELLAMTRVLRFEQAKDQVVSIKGAPETIFDLCHLNQSDREIHTQALNELGKKGYRVLAIAKANWSNESLPDRQEEFDFSFMGMLAFEDPIRMEVPAAVKECLGAGVRVIMITGDFPLTAKSIGDKIGLPKEGKVISGDELNAMSDEELRIQIKEATIFARVKPDQKLRIVEALKADGEVVAMTGDGVNDAPALKASHIGVAMGKKGTDVAREASSLVLLDDNFSSIVSAIRSGRRIFDNLQKAMSYIISIHIPIIGLTLIPAFYAGLPIFLLPLHIVFMELIIDPVCSIVFESEGEEKDIMTRKPRPRDESFFGSKKIVASVIQGFLLFTMVVLIYFSSLQEGHTEGEVRAIAFTSLILGNVFLILTNLSKTRSFISVLLEKNLAIMIMVPLVMAMLFSVIYLPFLQTVFSFQFPGFKHLIPSIIGASSMLLLLELFKYYMNRKKAI